MQNERLIQILNDATKTFLSENEVFYDALEPALKFKGPNQEFSAFLCSVLAYGRISQVKKNIHAILDPMGSDPVEYLKTQSENDLKLLTRKWKHRFNTEHDMLLFLLTMQSIYSNYGSLENYIQPSSCVNSIELLKCIHKKFYLALPKGKKPKRGFHFFIPDPHRNSASKRMNLFLKWMVRTDFPDLGLWSSFDKSKLIIPLDTHIYKQAKSLGWIQRTTADLTTALQITEKLKELDPSDPTRFDFALCHLSIRGTILKKDPMIIKPKSTLKASKNRSKALKIKS